MTDEKFADFGRRVAVDLGVLGRWARGSVERLVADHAREVFGNSSPSYLHNDKHWEAFKRLNEL